MTREDTLDAIMAVMEAGFDPHWREAWTRAQVTASMVMPSTHALLVDGRGQLAETPQDAVGFILSRHVVDEEELLLVAVRPEYRGKGIGRRLIETFADRAADRGVTKIYLEVRANNPAMALYRRAGFKEIGRRPEYYRTLDGKPIDAITFARNL